MSLCEDLITDQEFRRPLERVCTIMRRRQTGWYLLHRNVHEATYFEELYPAVVEELSELRRLRSKLEFRVDQLTFFGESVIWPPIAEGKKYYVPGRRQPKRASKPPMGTCVIIHAYGDPELDQLSYLFEAIVEAPTVREELGLADHLNTFIHVANICYVYVAGHEYEMATTYYCQQNGESSSCAHAFLKAGLWHSIDTQIHQPSTAEFNRILARTSSKPPGLGLTFEQCKSICAEYGANLVRVPFNKSQNAEISAYELAYLFVESGLPTIMVFPHTPDAVAENAPQHMVPVVGHTLNTDEWLPRALGMYQNMERTALNTRNHEYFLTSGEWVPHLVIHDDLLGPYFCIGPNALTRNGHPNESPSGRVSAVWAIVPSDYADDISPLIAQENGAFYIRQLWPVLVPAIPAVWRERIEVLWGGGPQQAFSNMVIRTIMLSKDEYLDHLSKFEDHEGNVADFTQGIRDHLADLLPSRLWMVEFSLPELYCGNLSKLGEVVLPLETGRDAELQQNAKKDETIAPPLLFRFIGNLRYRFDNKTPDFDLKIRSHVKLFSRVIT